MSLYPGERRVRSTLRYLFFVRPFSAEGYSEMSTENQMSSEIPAYSEIIQAPVLIYNIFSSQNPQFPYMKKPNLPYAILHVLLRRSGTHRTVRLAICARLPRMMVAANPTLR